MPVRLKNGWTRYNMRCECLEKGSGRIYVLSESDSDAATAWARRSDFMDGKLKPDAVVIVTLLPANAIATYQVKGYGEVPIEDLINVPRDVFDEFTRS